MRLLLGVMLLHELLLLLILAPSAIAAIAAVEAIGVGVVEVVG